jgi:hypothetical protein
MSATLRYRASLLFAGHRRLILLLGVVVALVTMLGGGFVAYHWAGAPSAKTALSEGTQDADLTAKEGSLQLPTAPDSVASIPTLASSAKDQESLEEAVMRRFNRRLEDLLPEGITEIQGQGGKGLQRQVKSHGAWYPVFDLSKAQPKPGSPESADGADADLDPDTVELAQVTLGIVSPAPPRQRVGQPWTHQLLAVGGTAPYVWAIAPGSPAGFSLNPQSGELTATGEKETTSPVTILVNDSAGATASATYTLAVLPTEPLTLATGSLPIAVAGSEFSSPLMAKGGVKPYLWELLGGGEGMTLHSATGMLTGTLPETGERSLTIRLTDAQQSQVDAVLQLRVTAGVEITTESPLLPASPLSAVDLQLEARGGQQPYRWSLAAGALPLGLRLSLDGKLTGAASAKEGLAEFTVRVRDARGTEYEKAFRWAVHQGLIAQSSRECVGLAWRASQLAQVLGYQPANFSLTRDGRVVYQGSAQDCVDSAVPTGAHFYVLSAQAPDGQLKPCATARSVVLPSTLQRGKPGTTADPYADRVRSFRPLSPGGYGAAHVPMNVTGPPDGKDTFAPAYRPEELASLHAAPGAGGSIVLEFTDNIVRSGQGLDFTVFENVFFVGRDPGSRFMEPAVVEVALWEGEWIQLPFAVNQPVTGPPNLRNPGYYAQGFAGISAATGEDPTNPSRSGGDSFDLAQATGLSWIRFMRITAAGDRMLRDLNGHMVAHTAENQALVATGSSGFDLDAVSAVHW